jgi:hypothetical protein
MTLTRIRQLNENPDNIFTVDGEQFDWSYGGYSFGYYKGRFIIAQNVIHNDLATHYNDLMGGGRENFDYSGRLWLFKMTVPISDKKEQVDGVISFWKYPENNEKLQEILSEIEFKLRKSITDKKIAVEYGGGHRGPSVYVLASDFQNVHQLIKIIDPTYSHEAEMSKKHTQLPLTKDINVPKSVGSRKIPTLKQIADKVRGFGFGE